MLKICAVELDDPGYDDVILELVNKVSEERRNKTRRYLKTIDKKRSILGEILLQYLLWENFNIRSDEIQFVFNEYGKPFLDKYDDIFFNISHSGKWLICGLCDAPIGIDVEGEECSYLEIADACFSLKETNYIRNLNISCQKDAFYKIWTLKESYVKCVGKGMNISFDSFYFDFEDSIIHLRLNGKETKMYSFHYQNLDEYSMSYCVKGCELDESDNVLQKISIVTLLNFARNRE